MNTAAAAPRPEPRFLPSDPRPDPSRALARSVTRAATAQVLTAIKSPNDGRGERILGDAWPGDRHALSIVTRAATAPATTSTAGWAAELAATTTAAAFLVNLPVSAASQLFGRSLQLPLDGVGSIKIPYAAATPSLAPSFTAEGAPIPVRQAATTTLTIASRKLAVIVSLTNEVAEHSIPVAEQLIRGILVATTATALDAAVFSTTAGSASQPAGILNGVSPLTAVAGGGQTALLGDIAQLVAAITAAGGSQVLLFAPPAKAAVLPIYAPGFAIEVIPTPSLPAGTVVAIDPAGVVSGTAGQPRIDVGKSTAIHYEDTTPLQISSGTQGSAVLATPVRSAFQTDSFALRLTLDCSWAARSGFVQFVPGTTW